MKKSKRNKITLLTSFDELMPLLSNSDKESVKIEDEKRLKQFEEAKKRIANIKLAGPR